MATTDPMPKAEFRAKKIVVNLTIAVKIEKFRRTSFN